jgi:hypothetical protein
MIVSITVVNSSFAQNQTILTNIHGNVERFLMAVATQVLQQAKEAIDLLLTLEAVNTANLFTLDCYLVDDPIESLCEPLDRENIRVQFGLVQQGHTPIIKAMLKEDKTWEEIAEAIGWEVNTLKKHWKLLKKTERLRHDF